MIIIDKSIHKEDYIYLLINPIAEHLIMTMIISYYSITLLFYLALVATPQTLCSTGCLACTRLQRICTSCDNGYQLTSNGLCIKTNSTQHCSIFNNNTTCLKCKPTFRLVNGSCIKDFKGCLQYDGNRCINCGFGTTLTNNTCVGTLHCQQYNNKTCLRCQQGYIFSADKCFYIRRDCVRVDPSSGACSVCAANLTLTGYTCQRVSSRIAYCDLWQGDKCLVCKQGWGLFQNKCVLIPECQSDQFMTDSYQCQQLPPGCMTADSNGCSKCNPNFILTNNSCMQNPPENCLEITNKGVCKTCKERYYSHQFQCRKVSVFCGRHDSYGRCLTCRYPYYQFSAGICRDTNCLNSTLDGCRTCKHKFIVEDSTGRCIINDPLCINSTDLMCNQCVSGYYASADVCLPLPSNCLKANREGGCVQCLRNYYLQLDQCFQTNKNISNCRTYYQYSDTPKCIECELGYFLSLGRCVLLPPHCNIVLSNGNCVTCANNLAITSMQCPLQAGLNCALMQGDRCVRCQVGYVLAINNFCYLSSDECLRRDPSGLCTQCKDGYLPSRMTCLAATLIDMNCKIYRNAVCAECYPGYYQANNVCDTPNPNCQQYDSTNGGCLSCFPGYILTNLQCIVAPKIQNCRNYSARGTCTHCQSFFYLERGRCVKVNQLCSAYNASTGACTRCFPGFTLKDPGCVLLALANIFNPNTNTTETTDVCEQYNLTNGYCTQCKQGYYLSDKKCINYASLANADLNCRTYKSKNECDLCYEGYTLDGGACRATNVLCRQFGDDGSCVGCFDGYALRGGVCVLLSVQQYDACLVITYGSCQQCRLGYKLNQGNCAPINTPQANDIPYCQYASSPNYCDICINGFYEQSGTCYQISPYCETYNATNGQCLTCKDQYVFSEGACVFPAMGVDPNCIKYEGVYCKNCKAGYYLKDYICMPIDSRCINFNFDVKQCLQCSVGKPLFDMCV